MKRITLIISGSIGAYKALELSEKLKKDYKVTIILSKNAHYFLKTENINYYQTLFTKNYYQKDDEIIHTNLAKISDLIIVYPASMSFISKITHGNVTDLASLVISCSTCPVLVFPAMNVHMYHNWANQANIKQLKKAGVEVIKPAYGLQACGDIGLGRLLAVNDAYEIIVKKIKTQTILQNKTILINYGRTRTYLDQMRYITNNSSGKMGLALVRALNKFKTQVISVVGDLDQEPIGKYEYGETNDEILQLMTKHYQNAHIVICLAALNDYQPNEVINTKVSKREHKNWNINLTANAVDILKTLGEQKQEQILIGFAAEVDLNIDKAKLKLKEKNLNGIIINNLKTAGTNNNEVIFIFENQQHHFKGSKNEVATKIIEVIANEIGKSKNNLLSN